MLPANPNRVPGLEQDPSIVGVALQILGPGVGAWLSDEHGVMHFHDTGANGPKRRMRFRVMVEPAPPVRCIAGANWTDPVALPERDPRRTFQLVENIITDGLSSQQFPCGNGKLVDCLLEVIRTQRENHLWEAIDFHGIPASATLKQGDMVPY